MTRRALSRFGVAPFLVAAMSFAGCGGDRPSPTSPTGVPAGLLGANPDGSTLKVTQPVPQAPANSVRLENVTPTLRFSNAQGLYVNVDLDYQVQILTEGGQQVYLQQVPHGSGQTIHTYPGQLNLDTTYLWRARATYQGQVGPWSDTASFQTLARRIVPDDQLLAFLIEFSQGNAEWNACRGGSGTSCFRFVYDAVQTMNPTCDPNSWGLLSKNPGEWQCTRSGCGAFGGQGFGEDVITHGGWSPIRLWDVVVGAGAPGAQLGASEMPRDTRRPGNNWACPWR
jgi:hypothetical protein